MKRQIGVDAGDPLGHGLDFYILIVEARNQEAGQFHHA